jgi:hypothetical protein
VVDGSVHYVGEGGVPTTLSFESFNNLVRSQNWASPAHFFHVLGALPVKGYDPHFSVVRRTLYGRREPSLKHDAFKKEERKSPWRIRNNAAQFNRNWEQWQFVNGETVLSVHL